MACNLGDLAAVVGAEAARAFMAAFPGQRVYVPATIGEHHPIAVAIGMEAAAKLASGYSGVHLEPPLTAAKRKRVLDLAAAGVRDGRIAAELTMSERSVRRIRAQAKAQAAERRQGKLPL
jgi:alkanesulfonate monooxygenase SsuD/methylene tetrahydromethanopterin reductase-like flavin-dependent oxidoreductase (luciferase family)